MIAAAARDATLGRVVTVIGTGLCLAVSAVPAASQEVPSGPQVVIGSLDGPSGELFDDVRGIVLLGDGIVVADGGSRELRHFSGTGGAPTWTFGRAGDGPGEFRSIEWVAPYRADSLAVWDPLSRRATIVGPRGALGRTFALDGSAGAGVNRTDVPAAERLHLVTAATDGRFVARAGEISVAPGDTTEVRRERFDYVLLDPGGAVVRRLVSLPDDEQFVWAEGGSRAAQPRAFARTTEVAVRGAELVFSTNEAFAVSILPLDGGDVDTMRVDRPARRVGAEDERRWRAENAPPAGLPAWAVESQAKLIEAMDIPDEFPAHGGLVVAEDGSIWLESYRADPGGAREWTRFARDGGRTRVSFPSGFRLLAVRRDEAWGVGLGEFDVERVVAYRLGNAVPGGPGGRAQSGGGR